MSIVGIFYSSIDYGKSASNENDKISLIVTLTCPHPYLISSSILTKSNSIRDVATAKALSIQETRKYYQSMHDINNQEYDIEIEFKEPLTIETWNYFKESNVFALFRGFQIKHPVKTTTTITRYTQKFVESYEKSSSLHGLTIHEYYQLIMEHGKRTSSMEELIEKVEDTGCYKREYIIETETVEMNYRYYITEASLQIPRVTFEDNFVDICEAFQILGSYK